MRGLMKVRGARRKTTWGRSAHRATWTRGFRDGRKPKWYRKLAGNFRRGALLARLHEGAYRRLLLKAKRSRARRGNPWKVKRGQFLAWPASRGGPDYDPFVARVVAQASPHFVIHRTEDGKRYMLTHIGSGMGAGRHKSKAALVDLAKRLERSGARFDFDVFSQADHPLLGPSNMFRAGPAKQRWVKKWGYD